MRAMTKQQLAQRAGVSRWTLQRWLNQPHMRQMLAPYNLKPKQQILPPGAVKIICEHYVIEID
jgi:predicted site-specific integrase-resolvase